MDMDLPAKLQRMGVAPASISTYVTASDGDRPAVTLLRVHINTYAFFRTHLRNTLVRSLELPHPPVDELAAQDVIHSAFTIEPPSRNDRLAVILATKTAIQGGQQ
ncbi:hypothetical protein BJV78DRAFT_1287368 [Lactifluus subvellereus]|nr:hypothetical protein BJV78DRAFT_1287368 [Lactifluus subvellereus]